MTILRAPNSKTLLARILADPSLPERVQALETKALVQLINQVGLEDCGEIVSLATTEQLQKVFDHDLWRSIQPGEDESFDPARFGLWLEVLLELGAGQAAEKISEMDQDFVKMVFSQLMWVVRFGDLQDLIANEQGLEKIVDSTNYYELEDYFIFSRQSESWDAVLNTIVELDRNHHTFLIGILENCAYLTGETMEENGGLYSVLTAEDQLKSDVAFEREKRRQAQGYVTPADARAFLKLSAGPLHVEDHVSPVHFRNLKTIFRGNETKKQLASNKEIIPSSVQSFSRVLNMLKSESSNYLLRMEELNFLSNVLVSGGVIDGRSFRPGEAAKKVLEVCEKGLSNRAWGSFIEAFRAGWTQHKSEP